REAGLKVTNVSDITGFPECLDGRVKTLHPKIHGGLLAIRDNEEHMRQVKELGIELIDLIVINLYPFKKTIEKPDVTLDEAIENIDIGGPAMLRASAKNFKYVAVVIDPSDYTTVLEEIRRTSEVSYKTRIKLARKVFEHTSKYDTMITDYLGKQIEDTSSCI
ncbi:MAG: bifunctional phosphoribosylaminoimidazolecarboxamide formyltransferase/IMP cyclohydrolase, partial [Clostridiaceae bacterium]|nr:bifunctional phosphoribosylaminoimidazolecarboxamide formyltransferase/IMP cyclohydrolase [Clostridiaceae bacterium]